MTTDDLSAETPSDPAPKQQQRSQGATPKYLRQAANRWGVPAFCSIALNHAADEIDRLRAELAAPVIPCPHGWENAEGQPAPCYDCLTRELRAARAELATWKRNVLEAQVPNRRLAE